MPLCPDQGICFLVFGNFISGFNSHSCLIIEDFTFDWLPEFNQFKIKFGSETVADKPIFLNFGPVGTARFHIVCQSHKPCCESLSTRLVVGNIAITSLVGRLPRQVYWEDFGDKSSGKTSTTSLVGRLPRQV